jgi:hypothetical protein
MNTLDVEKPEEVFNLTIEEVRIIVKYRALSRHQQRGIVQAMDLIRPSEIRIPLRDEQG